jgi:hypothetical protein
VIKKNFFLYLVLNWIWLTAIPTICMTFVHYLSFKENKVLKMDLSFNNEEYFILYGIFSGVGTLLGVLVYGIALYMVVYIIEKDSIKKYVAFSVLLLIDIIGLFIVDHLDFGADLLPFIHIPIYIVTAISGFYFIKLPISKEVNNMETDINIIDIN